MKKLLLLFSILVSFQVNAQNYLITFTGSEASASVSSVKVDNLTTGTTVTLASGTDVLNLTMPTAVNSPDQNPSSTLRIYPNPMTDHSTLDIFPPVNGETVITISEITGKPVAIRKVYLDNSRTGFRISGLKKGMYIVDVKGKGFRYSGKLVSNGTSGESISLEKENSTIRASSPEETKTARSSMATVDMVYHTGDLLKFTGRSGNYSTIVMDVPAANKAINFAFYACVDGDYQLYPVVTIGSQVWMAENLKSATYNDHTAITNETVAANWAATTAGSWAHYSNTPTYSDTYGKLYNWYTGSSANAKKVCPVGWHVPFDSDFATLQSTLGGEAAAGGKLKETGTAHWLTPNTGATNTFGFTALPGGYRNASGTFGLLGNTGYWWTQTESTPTTGWYFYISYVNGSLIKLDHEKHWGSSIRCIHD